MSLKKTAISGFKWSSLSQVGRQLMQLATLTVLARLLSPSDFGLLGMATVVTGFIEIFQDLGTSATIIQKKNLSNKFLSSIFVCNVLFGILATITILLLTPFFSYIYEESRLELILKILASTFFISSLSIVHKALLEKNLEFNNLAKVEIIATIVGSIIGVGCAFLKMGVWSLVYQVLAINIIATILLWYYSPWKPDFIFDWHEIKYTRNYSLSLTGYNIFNYLSRNIDDFLVGKFLGAQQLGYYTLAYRIMFYPLRSISGVISRVMFPVLSQMQMENARFRFAYLRVTKTIALITFPLMMGLWILAESFIISVFGKEWQPTIVLVIILAPIGMFQSIGSTVGVIYQAKGRTDWIFKWGIVTGILATLSFIIGLSWGIKGVAIAYGVASIVVTYHNFAIPFKLIDLPIAKLPEVLWKPFVSSLLMSVCMTVIKFILPDKLANEWVLGILIPTGIMTYLVASWITNRQQLLELVGLLKPRSVT